MSFCARFTLCFVPFVVAAPLWAQAHHDSNPTQLPVVVYGYKTPDQIPDELAYHHFFLATAESTMPTAEAYDRQQAKLAPLQLSASDKNLLVTVLARFRAQMDAIELQMHDISQSTRSPEEKTSALDSLRQQCNAMHLPRILLPRSALLFPEPAGPPSINM
jgi:hypothetical protein